MTYKRVKLGREVTFTKYLASVVSLIFLPKKIANIPFSIQSIAD